MLRPVASSLPLGFFAATGLTLLGAAWAATAITVASGPPGARSVPLAVFLLTLAPMMFVMFGASLPAKPLFGLLLLGGCRFALTGVYEATGVAGPEQAAGWLGVPLGAFALYGGLALLLEEGVQRTILPTGRRGRARSSLEGGLGHQIYRAEQEPGVRRQL